MPRTTMREGSTLVEIAAYAPGDGHLSFVARLTEDCTQGRRSESVSPPPTREECEAVCPYGWVLYQVGDNWRARPAA